MHACDRVNALLTGRGSCDRVGLFEHFWAETPLLWMQQGYPAAAEAGNGAAALPVEPSKVLVKHGAPSFVGGGQAATPMNPYRYFDYDMHPSGGLFDVEPLVGHEEILEQTDAWILKRNGAGATFRYWKGKSGTPEHVHFRMTDRATWERDYRPHLLTVDPERLRTGSWKSSTLEQDRAELAWGRASHRWCQFSHICIWETMRSSLGDVCMYESLILDPGWIRDFNRVYTDFFKAHFQLLFETLGLPDGIWIYEDMGYRGGLFAAPGILRDLVFPYYAELNQFFHSYHLPVVLHSCGNVTQALPLIIEAGFDALQPLEVKAGCDPFAFAEQYGDRLALIGGLDVRVLESNDRHAIEREVAHLINGMKSRGARYVFHSDHSITPNVTFDSYRYALDIHRRTMSY
jgi:uroporphyrinogen decarboxylase